jgi:hypothetical protein
MPQQLLSRPVTSLTSVDSPSDSDSWLEQTRQLFQHHGSNSELMAQVMNAIDALDQLCEQAEDTVEVA